jgi:Mg-chelatase subunit ChlD
LLAASLICLAILGSERSNAASAGQAAPEDWQLFGHDNDSSTVVHVDTTTGEAAVVGPVGFVSTSSGLAASGAPVLGPSGQVYPAGTIFGLLKEPSVSTDWVVALNNETGAGSKVVATERQIAGRGIAFGEDGSTLYLLEPPGVLHTIDTVSGAVAEIGQVVDDDGIVYSGVSLEWDPDDGAFYSFAGAGTSTLIRIDPDSAAAEVLGSQDSFSACTLTRAPESVNGPGGLVFPPGTWFTVNNVRGTLESLRFDPFSGEMLQNRVIGPIGPNASKLCGTAFAAPDLPPPVATSTASATKPPTAEASATPTATPTVAASSTPASSPIPEQPASRTYLPLALRERCDPSQVHTDVVLVIDASTSMLETGPIGRSKIDAAREGALRFIEQIDTESDRVAIVSFNSRAYTLQPLTGDRARLQRALAAITVEQTTRLDLAIVEAHQQLARQQPGSNRTRAMVLLTDGRANPVPVSVAVERARRAKEAGIRVFVIGLGGSVETSALVRMASSPQDYYTAADQSVLTQIYEQIAHAIPCPNEGFWGGRP